MSNERKGFLFVFLSAAGFGSIPIFARLAYASGANMYEMLTARFIAAWVLLYVYQRLCKPARPLNRRERGGAVMMGFCGYSLASLCFFAALQLVPASLASIILYTYPAVVTLLLVCIRVDKIDVAKCLALCLSFAGLLLVVGGSPAALNIRGITLALGASLLYSVYILIGDRTLKDAPLASATAWISLAAGVGIGAYGFLTGQLNFAFGLQGWLAVLGLAVFSTVIAILGFLHGVVLVGAARASIISTLEPPLTVILAVAFLSEILKPLQIAGGLLVLIAALYINRAKAASSHKTEQTDATA